MSEIKNRDNQTDAPVQMSAFGVLPSVRRRGEASQVPPAESRLWLVTFTDVMALMLTFFVLLFAMSSPDLEQWSEIKAALQTELKGSAPQKMASGMEDAVNMERINFNRALDISYLQAIFKSAIAENAVLSDVRLISQPGALIISMPQELLFAPGNADVKEEGRRALYVLGGALSRIRNAIEVTGHADPRAPEAGEEANWALSIARAASSASVLESVGYTRPITIHGSSSAAYEDLGGIEDEAVRLALARRVDIIIRDDDGGRINLFRN